MTQKWLRLVPKKGSREAHQRMKQRQFGIWQGSGDVLVAGEVSELQGALLEMVDGEVGGV